MTTRAIVVVVVLFLAGLAVYQWGRASAQRDAGDTSNEIASCRASYRSEMIDAPIIDGLAAAGLGDKAGIIAAAKSADRAGYDDLNAMSRKDPDQFLRLCRGRFGS